MVSSIFNACDTDFSGESDKTAERAVNPDFAPNGGFHGQGTSRRSCSPTTASLE